MSLYLDDVMALDTIVADLKRRGESKASRSMAVQRAVQWTAPVKKRA